MLCYKSILKSNVRYYKKYKNYSISSKHKLKIHSKYTVFTLWRMCAIVQLLCEESLSWGGPEPPRERSAATAAASCGGVRPDSLSFTPQPGDTQRNIHKHTNTHTKKHTHKHTHTYTHTDPKTFSFCNHLVT